MLYHEPSVSRLIVAALLALAFFCRPVGAAEHDTESGEGFSSVEERRLHVRIIEDQESLIEDRKALVLEEARLEKLKAEIDDKLEEIDRKLAEMEVQKEALEALLKEKQEQDQRRVENLGKIF